MKIFLDTANVNEIQEAASWGVLDGVTTNPTLVAKEGQDFKRLLLQICSIVRGPVSAEVVSTTCKEMVAEGRFLASLHENIVVKIPLIVEGLKAVKQLSSEGIAVNVTLCFSPTQALLAAKAGAAYVSPFVGRLDDISHQGIEIVREIKAVFSPYRFSTQILAASLRHPLHVVEAAKLGADAATMPFRVLEQMVKHPLTEAGLERFLKDWKDFQKDQKELAMRV